MALWGTIVNALGIMIGGLLGLLLPSIPQRIRETVMQGIGLALLLLGVSMALKSDHFLVLVGSLAGGGLIGEWIGIEQLLSRLGNWLEQRFASGASAAEPGEGPGTQGRFAVGFVTATLVYCVGAMAILGAMDGGIRHDHTVLYTKAMLDGFTAVLFASTLGAGVLFSAVPVFVYQGAIALASTSIAAVLSGPQLDGVVTEVTGVGGVLIFGIGINLLELKRIRIANLLPAIVLAIAAHLVFYR